MKSFSKNNKIYKEISNEINSNPHNALDLISSIEKDFNDLSYLALIIKALCINNKYEEAFDIYKNIPIDLRKKRFVTPIFQKIAEKNVKSAYNFFKSEILHKYKISEDDIIPIYKEELFMEIFDIISNNKIIMKNNIFNDTNFVKINNSFCKSCNCQLKKINLTNDLRFKLLNNLKQIYFQNKNEELNKLNIFIDSYNYNVFIDGNNILFFKDRKVNNSSYSRLIYIYKKLLSLNYTPLIFLHRRHKNKIIKDLPIYYTPFNMNDDWFFLWSSLKKENTFLLTNDNLKDHIYNISGENDKDSITNWINCYVIRYNYKNSYNLIFPKKYSDIAQTGNNSYHIPFTNNKWLCIK